MSGTMLTKFAKVPSATIAMPLEAANNLISAWKDYQNTHEIEETRRESIRANRNIQLAAIREQADALRKVLEGTFAERSKNFSNFFDMLNEGFSSDDDKKINVALSLITEQIKQNPMKQAVQLMQDINNPSVREIEI
jgi:hypothetical protein